MQRLLSVRVLLRGFPAVARDRRRNGLSPRCRTVVDIADRRAEAALVVGDSRPAATATTVVDLVVVGFQRYEVYRGAAVEDGEVWQHIHRTG